MSFRNIASDGSNEWIGEVAFHQYALSPAHTLYRTRVIEGGEGGRGKGREGKVETEEIEVEGDPLRVSCTVTRDHCARVSRARLVVETDRGVNTRRRRNHVE